MKALALLTMLAAGTIAPRARAAAQSPTQQAQPNRRELVGLVRDPAGVGIPGAAVEIPGGITATNERGAFQLWTGAVDTVTISIRRIGYAPVSAQIAARHGQWDTVVVEMEQTSQRLSAVTVTGTPTRRGTGYRDFEARRSVGTGIYITREEIADRNTMLPSDVLRGKRGVNLVRLRGGAYGVRFAVYSHSRPGCSPAVWIDGQLAPGLEIDDISANDIEAMELYETIGSTPFEFTPRGPSLPCGTIAVWTRIPGH